MRNAGCSRTAIRPITTIFRYLSSAAPFKRGGDTHLRPTSATAGRTGKYLATHIKERGEAERQVREAIWAKTCPNDLVGWLVGSARAFFQLLSWPSPSLPQRQSSTATFLGVQYKRNLRFGNKLSCARNQRTFPPVMHTSPTEEPNQTRTQRASSLPVFAQQ